MTRSFQDNRSFLEETACFSSNYGEAREKFLAASRAAGAELESFKNPFQGPDGEALYTDVVLLGAKDAETMLLLISGTHGVEGFTGSATVLK